MQVKRSSAASLLSSVDSLLTFKGLDSGALATFRGKLFDPQAWHAWLVQYRGCTISSTIIPSTNTHLDE